MTTAKKRAAAYRRDLQRLIAISFSAGELSKYAERWRVFTDREGGSEAGARSLVRALEGRDKLGALVESLRAHKPLVEWPDPPPAPTIPQPPAPEPEAPVVEPLDAVEEEPDDEADEAVSASYVPPAGDPLIDPYLPDATVSSARRGPMWWLPFVATGLAGIAVGATAMYVLQPERTTGARTTTTSIATLASEHMRERVEAFALACEVPTDGDSARDVLGMAFAECGIPELDTLRAPGPRAASQLPPPQPGGRRPTPQPVRRSRSPFAKPTRTGPACLETCQQTYTSCAKAKCGSEPKSASDNAAWSRCLHDCQSRRMRCRLACR
jgi:hypothetical protein